MPKKPAGDPIQAALAKRFCLSYRGKRPQCQSAGPAQKRRRTAAEHAAEDFPAEDCPECDSDVGFADETSAQHLARHTGMRSKCARCKYPD